MTSDASQSVHFAARDGFLTTQWSAIVRAADSGSPESGESLAALCRDYWYPLYAFVRRTGKNATESEDLTQGFFEYLLSKGIHKSADPQRGRFRSFLLSAFKNYINGEYRKSTRQKRGGKQSLISLDYLNAENRYDEGPRTEESPDQLFDREWANALFEKVLMRLKEEYDSAGLGERFQSLSLSLMDPDMSLRYADIALQLNLTESGVKTAARTLRQRFKALFREEIHALVDNPMQVDEEMRHLMTALS